GVHSLRAELGREDSAHGPEGHGGPAGAPRYWPGRRCRAFRCLPFAVLCYAGLLSVLYGITGFKIEKTGPPAPGPAGTESHQPPTAASPADEAAPARQEAGE